VDKCRLKKKLVFQLFINIIESNKKILRVNRSGRCHFNLQKGETAVTWIPYINLDGLKYMECEKEYAISHAYIDTKDMVNASF